MRRRGIRSCFITFPFPLLRSGHGLTLALSSVGEFLVWLAFHICPRSQQGLCLPPPSTVLLMAARPCTALMEDSRVPGSERGQVGAALPGKVEGCPDDPIEGMLGSEMTGEGEGPDE